jgi:hypothetical protein
MYRAVLWLSISVITLAIAIILIITGFLIGTFDAPSQPPPQLIPNLTGPWSSFIPSPGARCLVYPGNHIPYSGFGDVIGDLQFCASSNQVSAIQTQRTCLQGGCIDLEGNPQPVGYVEKAYQDCSYPFKCKIGDTGCFVSVPYCTFSSYTLVEIKPQINCLQRNENDISWVPCNDQLPAQQFNAVPGTESRYSFQNDDLTQCLQPSGQVLEMQKCDRSGWYLTPPTAITIPYNTASGQQIFRGQVASQLIYLENINETLPPIPNNYQGVLEAYGGFFSIQQGILKPFQVACTTVNPPPQLSLLPFCEETTLTATALLP